MPLKKKVQPVKKIVKKTDVQTMHGNKPKSTSGSYVAAVGRRKTAVARIRLFQESGEPTVNSKPLSHYFPQDVMRLGAVKPFSVIAMTNPMRFTVKVYGGGLAAQAVAVSHGLSRALVKLNPEFKPLLHQAGLLTRDPRMKETRKIGTGGKARRAKQSPKR